MSKPKILEMQGTVLYENQKGESPVTLIDNYNNYNELKIEVKWIESSCINVLQPHDEKTFCVQQGEYDGYYYLSHVGLILKNGNQIQVNGNNYYSVNGTGGLTNGYHEQKFKITKVIGYKN